MASTHALILSTQLDPHAQIAVSQANSNSCESISLFEACVPKLTRFSKTRIPLNFCLAYDKEHEIPLPLNKGDFLPLIIVSFTFEPIEPAEHHSRHHHHHSSKYSRHHKSSKSGHAAAYVDDLALRVTGTITLKTPHEVLTKSHPTSVLFHSELACDPCGVLDDIGTYFSAQHAEEKARKRQRCSMFLDMWCFRGELSQAYQMMSSKMTPPSLVFQITSWNNITVVNDKHGKPTTLRAQPKKTTSAEEDDHDVAPSRSCEAYYTGGGSHRRLTDLKMTLVLEYYQISASEKGYRKMMEVEQLSFTTRVHETNPISIKYPHQEHTFSFTPSGLLRVVYMITQPRGRVSSANNNRALDFSGAGPGKQPVSQATVRVEQYELETVTVESGCYFVYNSNKSIHGQRRNGLVFVLMNPSVNLCSYAPQGGFYAGLIDQITLTVRFNKFPQGKPGEQNVCIYTECYELIVAHGHAVFVFTHGVGGGF